MGKTKGKRGPNTRSRSNSRQPSNNANIEAMEENRSNDQNSFVTGQNVQTIEQQNYNQNSMQVRSGNKRKSGSGQNKNMKKSKFVMKETDDAAAAAATFVEDDNIVTSSAEGQDREYQESDDSDNEVVLNYSQGQQGQITEPDYEEGEIVETNEQEITQRYDDVLPSTSTGQPDNLSQDETLAAVQILMAKGSFTKTAEFLEKSLKAEMKGMNPANIESGHDRARQRIRSEVLVVPHHESKKMHNDKHGRDEVAHRPRTGKSPVQVSN